MTVIHDLWCALFIQPFLIHHVCVEELSQLSSNLVTHFCMLFE